MAHTLAIFGGSFDPPHVGHVLAVSYVLATQPVDEVWVTPTFQHPFDKSLSAFEHRVRMCELAVADLERASVCTVERDLDPPSLTLQTLERLSADHPDWQLRLVIGADVLQDAPQWHAFDRVRQLAPLIVLGRGGVREPSAPTPILPTVSSTEVRAALRARTNAGDRLHLLVPHAVLGYIEQHDLYR